MRVFVILGRNIFVSSSTLFLRPLSLSNFLWWTNLSEYELINFVTRELFTTSLMINVNPLKISFKKTRQKVLLAGSSTNGILDLAASV